MTTDYHQICECVGHEWAPAGGGLLICMICEAEKWDDRSSCQMCGAHPDDPCGCFDPQAERCECGTVSRGLVNGVCADCRDTKRVRQEAPGI